MDRREDDFIILDPVAAPQGGSLQGIGKNKHRPMVVSLGSVIEPHAAGLNGLEGNRSHPTPGNLNDPSTLFSNRDIQASRDQAVVLKRSADSPGFEPSKKSQTSSESGSSGELELDAMPQPPTPSLANLPTGLCYDVRMRYHCELDPPQQRLDVHPEDPRRIYSIYKELCKGGLVDDTQSTRPLVSVPLQRIAARNATQSEICLVHDTKHFDFIQSTKDMSEDMLVQLERQYDSIYFNRLTYASALLSTGGAIDTCRAVAGRQLKNAIAVIRPPGHHAECNRPMGFCIFDNVSISAKVCQADYPETCRKILIVDWDVHHGNGIQQAFYNDPNVLYISIHVHEDGNFYPSGPYGDHLHCGGGVGLGKNINIPWPTKGMGDADYLLAFQQVIMPVAFEFNPDFVIIAAGFDAAAGDQLGGCFVSPACYAHMTHMLTSLANGKLVACLEGGYNLKSISKSALAVTRTLMGEPPDRLEETSATRSGIATVQKVVAYQSRFWSCLNAREIDQDQMKSPGAERMHDIVRFYQNSQLYESHKMTTLWIYRDRLSHFFEKQVIATPNYHKAVPLLVIFHDPPEIMGTPNPVTKRIDVHNTWLADGLKHYVDWAAKQGFGVIDVNVPKNLVGPGPNLEEAGTNRISELEELAVYLWENYIDCNDATEIFFMGVGSAYYGIMHLINNRGAIFQRVTGIIHFIADEVLVPVSDQNIYYLSKWYKSNSCVFVSQSNIVWNLPPGQKKPSKRFGTLVSSSAKGMNEMLKKHQSEVQAFILGKLGSRNLIEGGRIGHANSKSAMMA